MNPWEENALEYQFSDNGTSQQASPTASQRNSGAVDPLIYPGLYAPSGFDIINILFRVSTRPNPQIDLGPVDCSVALLVCDLAQPDLPIVYVSDGFTELTGYTSSEIMGLNCRFLQAPGGQVPPGSVRPYVDREAVRRMRKAVDTNTELQIEVVNFKKDGQSFVNLLSMIPLRWDGQGFRYIVGFQGEK